MSFDITQRHCMACGGVYELWEHNESHDIHIHTGISLSSYPGPDKICKCKGGPVTREELDNKADAQQE